MFFGALNLFSLAELTTYELLRKQKKDGIAVLYKRYGRKLYGYAINTWHLEEDEAWDLIYTTLYKMLESFDRYKFESERKFGSFLFKIFVNYLRNHYRDKQKMKEHIDFTAFSESLFEEASENGSLTTERSVRKKLVAQQQEQKNGKPKDSMLMKALKQELDGLEDWQRILLLLRSQNMPYAEIARHVDKPADQLKVYYQRLKNKMKKKLQPTIRLQNPGI